MVIKDSTKTKIRTKNKKVKTLEQAELRRYFTNSNFISRRGRTGAVVDIENSVSGKVVDGDTANGVDSDYENVYDLFEWQIVDARISAVDSTPENPNIIFEKINLEFPTTWSQNAINIVAQKYFADGETSLKDMVSRVVTTIKQWGIEANYFNSIEQAEIFADELSYILISQRASFNSPVWFNIGLPDRTQQSSACFILSVEDSLKSILDWVSNEGAIFKGGSGAGVNLSNIRGSTEKLSGGGVASGPVSFMRGADASAGAIKSGGTTRRAAKMVVLDDDHPDILEFINCKALEEKKSRALTAAGFDMGVDGTDKQSIQFQNANNSVRLSEEFFEAVKDDSDWKLKARTTGETVKKVKAKELLESIAQAAWECADPGVQYDSTINDWHTTPNAGRISASNPCSEYFHLDNSACNLSSLNLLAFYDDDLGDGTEDCFDVEGFTHAINIMILAQDILVGFSDYPTETIGETARAYRQLGLGYTNLGALIMSMAVAYDSRQARELATGITALMTGQAYLTSVEIAKKIAPFDGFEGDRQNMLNVLRKHSDSLKEFLQAPQYDNTHISKSSPASEESDISESSYIFETANEIWQEVIIQAEVSGARNSQVTVLAPTGTISFMMDCDTTGIEPDFALVKTKQLVGGGKMTIVNQSVERALKRLGYDAKTTKGIIEYIKENGSIKGSAILAEHRNVFDCAVGETSISADGHILMMAAVQPFISGGISKTVNLPSSITQEEIADLVVRGHELGIKALAIYRDSSKVSQPLSAKTLSANASNNTSNKNNVSTNTSPNDNISQKVESDGVNNEEQPNIPVRRRLPKIRDSKTFEFVMSGCKGYVTVGEFEDGSPGEIFVKVSKQGSTLAGTMDAFAIAISHGLQYGVPLASYVNAFIGMKFEPTGITDDEDIRFATSIIDYIFRRLALMYLSEEEQTRLNIFKPIRNDLNRTNDSLNGNNLNGNNGTTGTSKDQAVRASLFQNTQSATNDFQENTSKEEVRQEEVIDQNIPICSSCGHYMIRAGTCFACQICGSTSGCS